MTTSSLSFARKPWTPLHAIVVGGLLAGAWDMAYALFYFGLIRGNPYLVIPQSIASGLLGKAAFKGGVPTAVLGVFLHWFIALSMATIYVFASRQLPVLLKKPVLCGLLYGAVCYFVMNYVVLPLSGVGASPKYVPLTWWTGLAGHMFGVGLAISLSAAKTLRED